MGLPAGPLIGLKISSRLSIFAGSHTEPGPRRRILSPQYGFAMRTWFASFNRQESRSEILRVVGWESLSLPDYGHARFLKNPEQGIPYRQNYCPTFLAAAPITTAHQLPHTPPAHTERSPLPRQRPVDLFSAPHPQPQYRYASLAALCYVPYMETSTVPKSVPSLGPAAETLIDQIASRIATLVTEKLEGRALLRPRWLNYGQAATYLGFQSDSALRQRKNQFPSDCYTTIGKTLRWDVDELDKWLDSKKQKLSKRRP